MVGWTPDQIRSGGFTVLIFGGGRRHRLSGGYAGSFSGSRRRKAGNALAESEIAPSRFYDDTLLNRHLEHHPPRTCHSVGPVQTLWLRCEYYVMLSVLPVRT